MPIFESACGNSTCSERGRRRERYYKKEYEAPVCLECGCEMERLISGPNVCWARPLSFYADKKIEAEQSMKAEDGHWVWRKRSTERADGRPDRVWVDSRAKQLEVIRREGLLDPLDVPSDVQPDSDGHMTSNAGKPGSWI